MSRSIIDFHPVLTDDSKSVIEPHLLAEPSLRELVYKYYEHRAEMGLFTEEVALQYSREYLNQIYMKQIQNELK